MVSKSEQPELYVEQESKIVVDPNLCLIKENKMILLMLMMSMNITRKAETMYIFMPYYPECLSQKMSFLFHSMTGVI